MGPTLLELDLTLPPAEAPPADPLAAMLDRRRPMLRDIVEGLHLAADDPDVCGLIAHVGGQGPSLAQAQEIAEAVRAFAAAKMSNSAVAKMSNSAAANVSDSAAGGKATIAWSETFGELGPATVPFALAAAFDEIWLQPSGDVGFTGIVAEAVFVKDALDRLGVTPQLSARREYKSAVDTFLSTQMTDAHREAASRLASSAMSQLIGSVAASRKLTDAEVRALVDRAPLSAEDALDAGLIDRLGYRDEVYTEARRRFGEVRLRYVHRYRRARQLHPRSAFMRLAGRSLGGSLGRSLGGKRPAVAIVHATGDIHLGRTTKRGFSGSSIGSSTLGSALRVATEDPEIKAVVLRIDSPGGSYVASDAIRREVIRVRESGRPVIVSMGTVAASGGYFVSMAADAIVALPATLTGSIGVFGGKAVVRDLLNRFGVYREGVSEGQNARMFSTYEKFSDSDWRRLEGWLDRVYADFTGKVASDRGLGVDETEAAAKGRVWTGADAQERGLVDELGGLERAVSIACARASIDRSDADIRVIPRLGLIERFKNPESSEDLPAAAVRGGGLELASLEMKGLRAPLEWMTFALGLPPMGVLTMPVLWSLR